MCEGGGDRVLVVRTLGVDPEENPRRGDTPPPGRPPKGDPPGTTLHGHYPGTPQDLGVGRSAVQP